MAKLYKCSKIIFGGMLLTPSTFIALTSCSNQTNPTISILFTNDIHGAIETTHKDQTKLGFSYLKAYRNELENQGQKTLLVDSGDFSQGTEYAIVSQGRFIVDMMNECKYDLTIPGNHEFDYGMDEFINNKIGLMCPMISSNFYNLDPETQTKTDRVLDDTKMIEIGGKKIGFVGVSAPKTISDANPKIFKDKNGKMAYTFLDADPEEFYSTVQTSIDTLKGNNVDYIIALTHLGIYESEGVEIGSKDLVKHTTGLNAVLDGHSHTLAKELIAQDKDGKDVKISQTGTGFASFGQLTIKPDKTMELNSITNGNTKDTLVDTKFSEIKTATDAKLGEKLGTLDFDIKMDDVDGNRLARKQEVPAGDFLVDAYAYATSTDSNDYTQTIAIANSGSVRANIPAGDVTLGSIMKLCPFGNNLVKIKVTGQELLDALEYSVCGFKIGEDNEFGPLLQVSKAVKYEANLTIETPVILNGTNFDHIDTTKPRRVDSTKVTINGETIVPSNTYEVALSSFLTEGGDGYNTLFKSKEQVSIPSYSDYNAIKKYFQYLMTDTTKLDQYKFDGFTPTRIILTRQ